MADGKISIHPETSKMQFNEAEMPKLVEALKTKTSVEAEAKEAALKLSGLAISYFENVWDSSKARDSAGIRLQIRAEIQKALETPEKANKTVEYLQDLQPNALNDKERFWKRNEKWNPAMYTYLPDLVVDLDDRGEVKQICLGKLPYLTKSGASPYTSVCGERK